MGFLRFWSSTNLSGTFSQPSGGSRARNLFILGEGPELAPASPSALAPGEESSLAGREKARGRGPRGDSVSPRLGGPEDRELGVKFSPGVCVSTDLVSPRISARGALCPSVMSLSSSLSTLSNDVLMRTRRSISWFKPSTEFRMVPRCTGVSGINKGLVCVVICSVGVEPEIELELEESFL